MSKVNGWFTFTLPYCLQGKLIAELDARVRYTARVGPGGAEIVMLEDVEIDAGAYDPETRAWREDWTPADITLLNKAVVHLNRHRDEVAAAAMEVHQQASAFFDASLPD